MTIKFECFADNYMCKDYFYRIYEDDYKRVTMNEYEFKKLFKDMAEELGYNINKKNNDDVVNKEEEDEKN